MRRAVMVLVAVSCLSGFAYPQTAEELVSKNIEAKGGIEKIKSAKTRLTTGKVKGGRGRVVVVKQMNMRPDLVRQNVTIQGMTAVQRMTAPTAGRPSPFADAKIPS